MPELETQPKVISKKNEGFPEWLDFEKLRQEGIDYLGELAGNIWTDHNAHDPGITILEVLCYALLDLGYRTSLPAKDLFAKDPDDATEENNFFTPAAILGCNPLTITDYRKLLVDVPGVKNAWLIPADDITLSSLCGDQKNPDSRSKEVWARLNNTDCKNFLNGLYHVYLDVETTIPYKKDVAKDETKRTIEDVIADVRKLLMSHRNLCEDFFDITILCKQRIGICAEIELHADADPEKVFVKVIERLREFLSPAPKFYRLKQLREKGRSMEEIFEGRPIDLMQSHGFVDVAELENIRLQKEIHISDMYNAMFSVEGIASVKRVRLRNSDGSVCPENTPWLFKIYKDHVPEFDLLSSGFTLTGSRGSIVMDTSKFAKYIAANPNSDGKALMYLPSPNVDVFLEQGNYRKELADYYPIENDFPKVYGIAEGSLPNEVAPQRRAQALQLREYLLFFDILLSGYLSQLKNIRSLFSFSQTDTSDRHTYFVNKLSNRPGLDQLVPFSLAENPAHTTLLAFPVCKKEFEEIIASGKTDRCNRENEFEPYKFCSIAERDVAMYQIIEDLKHEATAEYFFTNKSGCWSFYFLTSSDKFVIVGRDFYQQKGDAQKAFAELRYHSTSEKSFRRYTTVDKTKFSFNIVSSIAGYWNYLSLITENEKLFLQRRNGFLDHLLARFAETFTDYALLSYSFLKESSLQQKNIQSKEKFLSAYPALSSMRGKAYDYLRNGWNNNNVSGVERRFEGYAGIGEGRQENICHFEVAEFEEQTVVNITLKGSTIVSSNVSFQSREEGIEALHLFLNDATDLANYEYSKSTLENLYNVTINSGGNLFQFPGGFETEEMAMDAGRRLQRLFSPEPEEGDILPAQFEHRLVLEGMMNRWRKSDPVINRDQSFHASTDALATFGDTTQWVPEESTEASIKLISHPDEPEKLIDIHAYDPYVNRVDVRKNTTIYKYTVSDRERAFFFISEQEFEGEEAARENLLRLLFLLADRKYYRVKEVSPNEYTLQIVDGDRPLATNTIEFQNAGEATAALDSIVAHVQRNSYKLLVDTKPIRWKFELKLALPSSAEILPISSATEYLDPKEALAEARTITESQENIIVKIDDENNLELRIKRHPQKVIAFAKRPETGDPKARQDLAETLFSFKKTLGKIRRETNAPEGQRMVVPDAMSKLGNYGYRVVKKDGYHAWYNTDIELKDKAARTKRIAEVYKLYTSGEKYLQLVYGDRCVAERKDTDNTKWYHFRIVTRETDNHPAGIILFESVRGYHSVQEAQKAFDEQHVQVLTIARDEASYGSRIVFDETFLYRSGDCNDKGAQVFVPKETMMVYGHNMDYARQQLMAFSSAYPIQLIKESDPNFAKWFLCGERPKNDDDENCCCDEKENEFYFFRYNQENDQNGEWISQEYFTTAKAAMQRFNFFLLLLRYKGNYIIHPDDCDCRWRLSLREILAESKRRFQTSDDAWGKDGVEKFICISQSKDAFALYQNADDCCYSFFVGCSNMGLVHPCTYDTVAKRDRSLQRLYAASRQLSENKQKNVSAPWEEMVEVLEETRVEGVRNSGCEKAVALIERFWEDRTIGLDNPQYKNTQWSDAEKMKEFAHHFPVRRRKFGAAGDAFRYYLHINLPGFHEDSPEEPDGCGCESDLQCCTSWISECCFTTCAEALRYYYQVIECLADKDHYYPIMDCNCNSYGIRFYCECSDDIRQRSERENSDKSHPTRQVNSCCGEIVAYNPQCYTTPAMACEAIDRAKRLINAEGLHLVEHILLRPHCRESDCKCIIGSCPPDTCLKDFEWELPAEDPCAKEKKYCFVPGADPYSFIATVALPAWPERFRKNENRQIVEKLLYREMPSHILLRILWLTPQDLCKFESIYHQWTKWLALKPVCADYEPACRLINFLFNEDLRCFECEGCEPCAPGSVNDPCDFLKDEHPDPNAYVNELNNLYCWNNICRPAESAHDRAESLTDTHPVAEAVATEEGLEEAARKIDARFERYRQAVNTIRESSGNVNAELAAAFLKQVLPDFESYKNVIDAVVANKRLPENRRLLSLNEKKDLIQVLTWNYLDRNVLKRRVSDNETGLMALFQALYKKQLLPDYKKWKSVELTKVERDAPVHEVKKLFDTL